MPDNPNPLFALPGHRVLEISGRDATAFAHAQFMNDVAGLAGGAWQWNGWLTPKGRVVALFALLKLETDRLWLLLPDADPSRLAEALQRFVFRSKVVIEPRVDCRVAGAFAPPARALGAQADASVAPGAMHAELDFGGDGGPRTLRIDTIGTMSEVAGMPDSADVLRWMRFDIQHGLPRLPPSQEEQWTPQMLSLDRLRAYSVKKGCYPGQEIVARTHFLGQAKRGLVLLEGGAPVAPGTDVVDGDRSLGMVVSSAGLMALAVLPLERDAAPLLRAGEVELSGRPLQGGLAR